MQRYAACLEEQDYAWRTIYLEVSVIKQIVKWLIKEGQLHGCLPIELPLEKAYGTTTYCWKATEVSAMIAHCRRMPSLGWLGHVVAILACTGLRMGELASLRWSDIDFTEQMLRLTEQTSMRRKTVRARRQTKTGHSRSFPINPDLMAVLQKIPKSSRYVIEGACGWPVATP